MFDLTSNQSIKRKKMSNDIEKKLQKLNKPEHLRVTPQIIDNTIKDVKYIRVPNSTMTICILTLQNGFSVTGQSACASIETFDKKMGEEIAYDDAKDKIDVLEGYLLRQRLFENGIS